jgi:phospholipase/carboxylesterase
MKIFLSIFLITFMNTSIHGQATLKSAASLQYLVRQPKIKTEKTPLIILLHGVGSNEEDLFSLADHLPDNFLVVSARGPYTISPGSYAWYQVDFTTGKPVYNIEQEENSRIAIFTFIDELKKQLTFDQHQVYVCGFSQGAIMSYSVGLTRPDLVKGIAVMSGRLLEEVKPLIASKDKLKPLRVYISHGTLDNTLSIQYARTAVAFLKEQNINAAYKEYPEGHGINDEMLFDLVNWLKKE